MIHFSFCQSSLPNFFSNQISDKRISENKSNKILRIQEQRKERIPKSQTTIETPRLYMATTTT